MEDQNISMARLQLILDSTLEGWWEWDIANNTTYHSPQWYRMLGYQKDEWPSTFNVWAELMHPEDMAPAIERQNSYMQSNDCWESEFRMRCKTGEYKWILSRGRTVERDPKGNASKIVGIHLDISERKKNEALKEEYRKQEDLLKGIIKVSPAGFKTYYYLQKKMTYASHVVARFLNYTPEEFEQFSENFIQTLIHPEDVRLIDEALKKLLNSNSSETVECIFRVKKRNGEYTWVKTIDWISKRAANGQVEEIIGSIQDISRYKELDEKILQSIKVLENVSYKNSHLVRGPVSSILGLTNLIKNDWSKTGIDPLLLEHLERTVIKLDEVIREFNNSLSDQLGDIS